MDTTKGGEVVWLLKALEQRTSYYEHSLESVLKLIGYYNMLSDLGQSRLTMFRLTTYSGASKKAVPFNSDPLHECRIILGPIATRR